MSVFSVTSKLTIKSGVEIGEWLEMKYSNKIVQPTGCHSRGKQFAQKWVELEYDK